MLMLLKLFINLSLLLLSSSDDFSIETSYSSKIVEMQGEFKNFISKYKSHSCIIDIFKDFHSKCENIDDETSSAVAYHMTICIFKKLGKEVEECQADGNNFSRCISRFTGDIWTTYTTFTRHIDNLCFYYKTLLWEKSSEFLFMRLINSSVHILTDLRLSSQLAERMISSQEQFSTQLQSNLTETIDKLSNVNQFFENYTKVEEKLKENIYDLEEKLEKNNNRLTMISKYVDEKFKIIQDVYAYFYNEKDSTNSLFFYFIFFIYVFFLVYLLGIDMRIFFYTCVVICFAFEKYAVYPYFSTMINFAPLSEFNFLYTKVAIFISRGLYLVIVTITCIVKKCYFTKDDYSNPSSICERKTTLSSSEIKGYLAITPMWVRKYFSRVEVQNDTLIRKFKKMTEIFKMESQKQMRLTMEEN